MRIRILFASLLVLSAQPARAQSPGTVDPNRRDARVDRALSARDASALLPDLGPGEHVTYEQVMAAPDDIPLNYRYAQTQIREGDLPGAVVTLERILLLDPSLADVHLLYAVVLYRMDNLIESRRVFEKLSKLDLPPDLRRKVDAYLEDIDYRSRRTRISGRMSVGFQVDTNRNAGPESDRTFIFGANNFLTGNARDQDDVAFLGILSGEIEHDLERRGGHTLFANATLYNQKQIEEDRFSLLSGTTSAGIALRTRWAEFRPQIELGLHSLGQELMLFTGGVRVEAYRPLSEKLGWTSSAGFAWEDHDDVQAAPSFSRHTGFVWGVDSGLAYQITPQHGIDAQVHFLDKMAKDDGWAYRGAGLEAGYTWLMGRGRFLRLSQFYEHDSYRGTRPQVIRTRQRDDDVLRTRLTLASPIAAMVPWVAEGSFVGDLLTSLTTEYYRAESDITNYEFDDWKVALLFTKRWRL